MNKYIKKIFHMLGLRVERYQHIIHPLDWIKKYNIQTVFDIGANTGQFASEIREVLPEAKIYSFEPIRSVYNQLVDNLSKDLLWKGFNFAIGSEIERKKITVSPYTPSSSLLDQSDLIQETFPHIKGGHEEEIDVETLDHIEKGLSIDKNVLLKLDIQGYELHAIKSGKILLSKTKIVLIETSFFRLYKDQPLFNNIYNELHTAGFAYRGGINQKRDPKNGEILFEDSFFVSE